MERKRHLNFNEYGTFIGIALYTFQDVCLIDQVFCIYLNPVFTQGPRFSLRKYGASVHIPKGF